MNTAAPHPASFLLTLLLLCAPLPAIAQSRPALQAVPTEGDITIDGHLTEAAWSRIPPTTGFKQSEPQEGAPATYPTEVRVLYGPTHLYVGAHLIDEAPGQILPTLGRRDEINQADWFIVSIDSYFDQKTAYLFGVNAAGVQYDAILSGSDGGPGGPGDPSWDAIWASGITIDAEGWSVELRIPYSMLRFAHAETQTWGIHFQRRIPRLGEEAEWPLVPRTERANLVAQFGLLEGLRGVTPRRNLQVRPYTLSRLQTEEHATRPDTPYRTGTLDVGGDLKVGLGSGLTLDVTVNPDFGQVESDPAVLNLTAFETFFDERRPFFIEGSQIYEFSAGPGQLLYTRRIGSKAPIIGAAKLSGRTEAGLSVGLLGATTGDAFTPNQHYGVSRLSQQLGRYSSAGGILTVFDGPTLTDTGRLRSVAGGADWDLRILNNRYGFEGFATITHRRWTDAARAAETGFAGKLWFRKRQGVWTYFSGVDVFSDQFNPNDVGQLRENNFVALLGRLEHEINGNRPFGPFQRASAEAFFIQQVAYANGLNLGPSLDVSSRWTLRGFQQISLGMAFENFWGGYDLYETRGLGPWAQPFSVGVEAEIETDTRRAWQIEPEVSLTFNDDGGREYGLGMRGTWNVGTRVSVSGDVDGRWEDDVVAWSSNESLIRTGDGWLIGHASRSPDVLTDDDYVAFDDRGLLDALLANVAPYGPDRFFVPVFGARDTRSLDLTLRSTVTFTPNLSLQLYSQLFLARGDYNRFQILHNRDTLVPFEAFPKRDTFAFSNLQSNVVLRWEYRPGSTLYLVWTHGRHTDDRLNPLAPWGPSPYDTPLGEHIADTFQAFPSNVFILKLNYAFLY